MSRAATASPRRDIVYLHGLRVEAVIGVLDWERHVRQALVVDIDLACDTRAAAASDRLEDALDYAAVAARITQLARDNRRQLIEALAEDIAATVMREFDVPWLRLRLAKPGAVANCADLGVLIERGTPQ